MWIGRQTLFLRKIVEAGLYAPELVNWQPKSFITASACTGASPTTATSPLNVAEGTEGSAAAAAAAAASTTAMAAGAVALRSNLWAATLADRARLGTRTGIGVSIGISFVGIYFNWQLKIYL